MKYSIYVLIKDSVVIYIGRTTNLYNRISSHKAVRDFDSYSEVYHCYDKEVASDFERTLTCIADAFGVFKLENITGTSKNKHLVGRFQVVNVKKIH